MSIAQFEAAETAEQQPEYVYTSTVRRKYGLTPKMIAELGPPDDIVENPHYRRGDACLYRVDRVVAWVARNSDRVEKALPQRVNRSAAAKKAHEHKQQERLRQQEERLRREKVVADAALTISPLPETLLDDARAAFRGQTAALTKRQLVAHVRHALTNYPDLLRGLRDDPSYYVLSGLLPKRADAAIRDALRPWLAQRPGDLTFML